MKKKVLFGLAAVTLLVFTACKDPLNTETEEEDPMYGWYGDGTASSFTIDSFTELKGLANIVRGTTGSGGPKQSDFRGKIVTLTSDIDMTGETWTGIGDASPVMPFNGTFDGDNNTISDLTISGHESFFGQVGEYGTVKNLVFVTVSVTADTMGGAIIATENYGVIQNISITNGTLSGTGGGIVDSNRGGIVENCFFSGSVFGGGLGVGGIARYNDASGVIRKCYVSGSISTTHGGSGGIIHTNAGTVQNCFSDADIISGNLTFLDYTKGGIVGENRSIVEYCYATGSVTGWQSIGGIAGSNTSIGGNGTIRYCVALHSSLTFGNNDADMARITFYGNRTNNYARDDMTVDGAAVTSTDPNGVNGEDVAATVYNTQTFWEDTVGFDFATIWQWDASKNLPVLR